MLYYVQIKDLIGYKHLIIDWQSTDVAILRTLGERLKHLRLAVGCSQQQLAESCGVSVPVIVRMERGDGGVKFATWIAALRVLGKIQNLEQLLPEAVPTPYDYAESAKPQRQRAPRSDRKRLPNKWEWGE